MAIDAQHELAILLRRAADGQLSEDAFWLEFRARSQAISKPLVEIALESATHFWGNFHERSLFLFRVRPDPGQLEEDRNQLRAIADGIESGVDANVLERRLRDL